jgi:hypothetical protein
MVRSYTGWSLSLLYRQMIYPWLIDSRVALHLIQINVLLRVRVNSASEKKSYILLRLRRHDHIYKKERLSSFYMVWLGETNDHTTQRSHHHRAFFNIPPRFLHTPHERTPS